MSTPSVGLRIAIALLFYLIDVHIRTQFRARISQPGIEIKTLLRGGAGPYPAYNSRRQYEFRLHRIAFIRVQEFVQGLG